MYALIETRARAHQYWTDKLRRSRIHFAKLDRLSGVTRALIGGGGGGVYSYTRVLPD